MRRTLSRFSVHIVWRSFCWASLVWIMVASAVTADDGFRDEFDGAIAWIARPDWLTPHAEQVSLSAERGVATFSVNEPSRGMKWWRALPNPVELELSPWLVLRYRAEHLELSTPEYHVWLKDAADGKDGVKILQGEQLSADGRWHTVAVNLQAIELVSPVTAVAVQCWSDASGSGRLQIDFLALTDTLPEDAVILSTDSPPAVEKTIRVHDPALWTVQPSWLGNYSTHHRVTETVEGLEFCVAEGLTGVKWSYSLLEPIDGVHYVTLRYRARYLRNSNDYVLYVSSGDAAITEQYVIRESDLVADGQWRVVTARVALTTIRQLALQVQAAQNDGRLEVAEVRFTDTKPVVHLADVFEYDLGWSLSTESFRPIDLPTGNMSGPHLAGRLGVHDWLAAERVTASAIPFLVRSGRDSAVSTSVQQPDEIRIDVAGQASEVYLLMAAEFPHVDEPSYGGTSGQVRHVHRFVVRIDYADDTSEEQFPFAVAARVHAISRGLHVYALAIDPAKQLRNITLVDTMNRGLFAVVAATLGTLPGPASESTQLHRAPQVPSPVTEAQRNATIVHRGSIIEIAAQSVDITFDLGRGLWVENVINRCGGGMETTVTPGPLFRLTGKAGDLLSTDFTVTHVEVETGESDKRVRVDLKCDKHAGVAVSVWLDVAEAREIGMTASVTLGDLDPATTSFVFPELHGIGFGGSVGNTWIWCPRRGDVMTAAGVSLREPYAGAGNPLQIVGAFDPNRGAGLYVMTQDMDGLSKFYQVQKDVRGAGLAVEYLPLHESRTARTVIGCTQGDWHAHLSRYREWVASWYAPAAPRKNWFRQVWNFRQQFMHFALPSPSGIFDAKTRSIKLQEVAAADAQAFGGIDYLHVFDWGWDPVHGRCGDYEPWEYLGGVEHFRHAVAEVQSQGTPVGLYIEGILVDPQSNLGKAHGEAWQMLGPAGKPYAYFAPSFHICPRIPAWQDYLADTYGRVRSQTGADGFYIDEYGFSGPTYWCYNPNHTHAVPVTPVLGEREMLQKVREKLGSDAVIYTEESPTDVNSQYQDGSFTYNISSVSDELSPSHVNLYRFAFPDFKTIEIICCDQPLGTNVEAVKRCLFNGEAIWIEGIRDRWFSPPVLAEIAQNRRVMRKNQDCFASDHVRPLVPTLWSGIYANQFGPSLDSPATACWTVYNTNYRTICDEVIAVPHMEGSRYWDEITDKPVACRVEQGLAYLQLTIAPRDVAVVSCK